MSAAALVAVGAAATASASVLWHRALVNANAAVVHHEAAQLDAGLASSLRRYGDLVAVIGQELGSGGLDSAQFAAQVNALQLRSRYPGLGPIGFVAYVPATSLPAFVAARRAQGDPGYQVVPAGQRPVYCLETSVDWPAGMTGKALEGFDYCSLGSLRRIMFGDVGTGLPGIIGGSHVVPQFAHDLFIATPCFRGDPRSTEGRHQSLLGWSAVGIDGTAMFRGAGVPANGAFAVSLYSGERISTGALVASSGPARKAVVGTLTQRVEADGHWTVRTELLAGAPGVVSTWMVPLVVLAGGLLLLVTRAALGLALARGRREAELSAVQSQLAMERSEARFASITAASPIGIIETSDTMEITYLNPRLEAITGRTAHELLGTNWMAHLHPDDRPSFVTLAAEAIGQQREIKATFRIVRPTGEVRTVRLVSAVGRYDKVAGGYRYVASVEDVSDEIALQEQLRHQALHDALTGLPNRTLFVDRLGQAIEQSRRGERMPAVLFLDVDRFKVVNDSLGHRAGDELLVQLAGRLRSATRRGETVARLGGDEFTVLLPGATSVADAVTVAKRILQAVEEPFRVQQRDIVVSVSIGIVLSQPTDDPDTALRAADAAMYRAKEEGRGSFAVFQEGLHERSLQYLTLETEIRQGLQRGEFEVYFQPIVDLATDAVFGAEALVRWNHPLRGLLAPDAFIPVAEETGLIVPLGQWVWGAAIAQLAVFDADPDGPRLGTLSINLSSHQLRSPNLDRERQALSRQHGIDPRRICIELTETVVMDESETTRGTLRAASQAGVKVAIDDFGTGYSSLAYLQTLPVSTLKIDRRFMAGVGTDASADAIVAAIVEMAHRPGLAVVAEGVEDEVQRQRPPALGSDPAERFPWARPPPAGRAPCLCPALGASPGGRPRHPHARRARQGPAARADPPRGLARPLGVRPGTGRAWLTQPGSDGRKRAGPGGRKPAGDCSRGPSATCRCPARR